MKSDPVADLLTREPGGTRLGERLLGHVNEIAGRLAGERTSRKKVGDRLDLYLRSLREHDNQTIQHDIAWLDELIANERTALTATAAGREEDSAP